MPDLCYFYSEMDNYICLVMYFEPWESLYQLHKYFKNLEEWQ